MMAACQGAAIFRSGRFALAESPSVLVTITGFGSSAAEGDAVVRPAFHPEATPAASTLGLAGVTDERRTASP